MLSSITRCTGPLALLCLLDAVAPQQASGGGVTVPRWQPRDFEFRSTSKHGNPFDVSFECEVTRPDGGAFTSLGFHDGDDRWVARIAPDMPGEWKLKTISGDPELDGHAVSFTCVANPNPRVHGGLRVDANHPHHFRFEDGSRFFLMGYECDWLWALDMHDPALPILNAFLDKLLAHGFNYIILNAFAYDTPWRLGRTGDFDYGPPPLYPWEGTNDRPDHTRLNLAYWKHYDRVIDALYRRGIIAHIMVKVYNKHVNWPTPRTAEDDRYFRWMAARYAAYPNVVFDFSKESYNERDLSYKLDRLRLLRASDPYRRPLTVHDDDGPYDKGSYYGVLDYRTDQHHDNWHAALLAQRRSHPWPVLNAEFGYEHGPEGLDDKTYGVVQSPEEVCRRAWEIAVAGGYTAYYYTYTAWDVVRTQDTPPGYAYFRNFRRFFERTRFWQLEPSDDLVSEGSCLSNPGREYVVFQSKAAPLTLRVGNTPDPLRATWYRPLTGETIDAGTVHGGTIDFSPPERWGNGLVALHLSAAESGLGAGGRM